MVAHALLDLLQLYPTKRSLSVMAAVVRLSEPAGAAIDATIDHSVSHHSVQL
jgi:hypothetical protein